MLPETAGLGQHFQGPRSQFFTIRTDLIHLHTSHLCKYANSLEMCNYLFVAMLFMTNLCEFYQIEKKIKFQVRYQFQTARPRKALEAKSPRQNGLTFQKEHIDQAHGNWLTNVNNTALNERDWEQFVNSGTSSNQIDVLHSSIEPIEPDSNTEQLLQVNPLQILKTMNVMMMIRMERSRRQPIRCYSYFITRTRYEHVENVFIFYQVKETDLKDVDVRAYCFCASLLRTKFTRNSQLKLVAPYKNIVSLRIVCFF